MSKKRSRSTRAPKVKGAAPGTLSYELPVDLDEKQIEADVAGYFGFVSAMANVGPGGFRLIADDEQVTGADKSFTHGAVTYYLQFKKPCALRPVPDAEAQTRLASNAGLKQHIRRFRKEERLAQDPYSVCFPLHDMAKTALNFQHNILRSYEQYPYSRAFYLCPLILKASDYVASMHASIPDVFPFLFREALWARDGDHVAHVGRMVPFLREHAAIVPHKDVDSADHYYSFSRHATDVAFHSPERVVDGPARLSDFVASEVLRLSHTEKEWPNVGDLNGHLLERVGSWANAEDLRHLRGQEDGDPFDWLQLHGRLLRKCTGIRQVVALKLKQRP